MKDISMSEWSLPSKPKIYEALTAVADGRVKIIYTNSVISDSVIPAKAGIQSQFALRQAQGDTHISPIPGRKVRIALSKIER